MAFVLFCATAGCASSGAEPEWIGAFGYTAEDIVSIDIGAFGFPYVPVTVAGTDVMLMFDTGNMVGVSISTHLFDQLGLSADSSWRRRGSAGEDLGTFRMASAVEVSAPGREPGPTRVYEWQHPTLAGLVGPHIHGGGRFTLDYRSRSMAMSRSSPPDAVPGFRQLPLVRSRRHPTLIIVRGTIEGRPVLIQLDTGKSRTVVNPALAADLGLRRGPGGVAISRLELGELSFRVRSAKEVDQSAIDPSLPDPILVGVGSDILSRFVWTVDYDAGVLWIPAR